MTAASQRDRFRRIAYRYRNLPGRFGLRPYAVAAVFRQWTGAEIGQGTYADTETAIVERDGYPPKVRWLTEEEIAVGGYSSTTIEIGPVTPDHTGGGTAIGVLTQTTSLAANAEVFIRLTGPEFPDGEWFRRIATDSDAALHYKIRVQKIASGA